VLVVSLLPLSTIFIFHIGIVPNVWYFSFFILLPPFKYNMCDRKVGHIFPSNIIFEVHLLMNVFAHNHEWLLLLWANYLLLYNLLGNKRKTKYDESSSLFLEMLNLVSIMSSIKLCNDDEISCNQIYPLCNVITHVMTLYLENYVRSKQF
jgi:hypothetical protein